MYYVLITELALNRSQNPPVLFGMTLSKSGRFWQYTSQEWRFHVFGPTTQLVLTAWFCKKKFHLDWEPNTTSASMACCYNKVLCEFWILYCVMEFQYRHLIVSGARGPLNTRAFFSLKLYRFILHTSIIANKPTNAVDMKKFISEWRSICHWLQLLSAWFEAKCMGHQAAHIECTQWHTSPNVHLHTYPSLNSWHPSYKSYRGQE